MGDLTRRDDQPLDLDLLAASLRADAADETTFFEVLGNKLADALGERVELERDGGLLRKGGRIRRVVISLGDDRLEVAKRRGGLAFTCGRVVRGIVLRTEEVDLGGWIAALVRGLGVEARRSETTRLALQELLG